MSSFNVSKNRVSSLYRQLVCSRVAGCRVSGVAVPSRLVGVQPRVTLVMLFFKSPPVNADKHRLA